MAQYFDPHTSHYFLVEFDGTTAGRFQEVSGLGGSNEVYEIKEGGLNDHSHKFVTRTTYNDLVLKRGFWNDPSLFRWFEGVALSTWTERRDGSIILLQGKESDEVARWNFMRAFPTKWDGPTFNATASAAAMESCTLTCEWIEMVLPG
ncbi:MAG: phage tail protein [Myxococcales bacterium]|nr:phage tail protein [Myxococcales bacterium]